MPASSASRIWCVTLSSLNITAAYRVKDYTNNLVDSSVSIKIVAK